MNQTCLGKEDLLCYINRSWSVAWPMILIMLFEFMIGLTDVFVAGRVGKEAQATYGYAVQLYFMFVVIANALTVGTVSIVSRQYTAGDPDKLSAAVFSSITVTSTAGVGLSALGVLLAPTIVRILNMPPELRAMATPFVRIYAAGLLSQYVMINCDGILRSCNMVRNSLKSNALTAILNVCLCLSFVFRTSLGYKGIALATAIAVTVGALINLYFVRKVITGAGRFVMSVVKDMVKIGWPMGALQVLWQLASVTLFLIIGELPQERIAVLAAFAIGLRVESVIYLPVFALNMANAVIVGNLLGEKRLGEAYKSGLTTAGIGVAAVAILVLIVVLNARWIMSLLSTNDVVVREGIRYLYISMISEPFMACSVVLGGGLNGAGDTRGVMIRVALALWIVRIPLAYALVTVFGFGPSAIWWSMNASQIVQAFLMYRRYAQRAWLR
jgi:multidrug resistance protein, MATE family